MDRDQSRALTLRHLTALPAEMRALQRVHEAAPSYYLTVSGRPPGGHVEGRAHAFWPKLGYRETGAVKPAPPGFLAAMRGMEKPLRRDAVR